MNFHITSITFHFKNKMSCSCVDEPVHDPNSFHKDIYQCCNKRCCVIPSTESLAEVVIFHFWGRIFVFLGVASPVFDFGLKPIMGQKPRTNESKDTYTPPGCLWKCCYEMSPSPLFPFPSHAILKSMVKYTLPPSPAYIPNFLLHVVASISLLFCSHLRFPVMVFNRKLRNLLWGRALACRKSYWYIFLSTWDMFQ